MSKTPRITIEDLALMVKKGFDANDKRFDEMDKRFDAMDKRFDTLEAKFEASEAKFEKIVIQDHAPRLKRLERKVSLV